MNRILVTGATGFLGRHLVSELLRVEPPGRVRVLSRRPAQWSADPGVEVVAGDVIMPEAVDRAVADVDQIYHLAGVRGPLVDRKAFYRIHVEGTRNICRAAARHRVRKVVVVSTSGTSAVSARPSLHDERAGYKHECIGAWPYYQSKLIAEKLALSYAAEADLPVIVVNPSLILGPGGGPHSSNRPVELFLTGKIRAMPRGGLAFVDVRDVATGLISAAARGRTGERYLMSAANWSFREFFNCLSHISGRPAPKLPVPATPLALMSVRLMRSLLPRMAQWFGPDETLVGMSALFWYVDSSKARAELGFQPRDPVTTLLDTTDDLRRREPVP